MPTCVRLLKKAVLPFRVDLFVWDELPKEFHKNIEKAKVVVQIKEEKGFPEGWKKVCLNDVATVQSGFAFKSQDMGIDGVPVIKIKNLKPPNIDLPEGWIKTTLGNIAEIDMGQSPEGASCNKESIGTPLLNGPTEFGSYHPIPFQYTTQPKKLSQKNDLLFCVRGSTTGRMNWSDQVYAIGRGIASIRHKYGNKYQPFLKALVDLNLPTILKAATGSTFPNVSKQNLLEIHISLPSLNEQKAIAHILGSLDDKIELNRRMNETLEAMAQALFQSWFVDFDPVIDNALAAGNLIPDEFKERAEICQGLGDERKLLPDDIRQIFPSEFEHSEEMGWIPKGWQISTVESIAEKVAMGPFGSSIKVSTFVSSGIPVISGKHLNNTLLQDSTHNFITAEHAAKLKNSIVAKGDIIFTHSGNIGQVSYIPESSEYDQYILSQRQFYLRCNKLKTTPYFMIYFFKSLVGQHKLLANSSSTGVPSIARPVSYLKTIEFLRPPQEVVLQFSQIIKDVHNRLGEITLEIKTLSKIRESLLPRFISGKLHIKDMEGTL